MKRGDCVYYTDWEDEGMKYPAYVLEARRTWATVILYDKEVYNGVANRYETWDVPIEDLQLTNHFDVTTNSLCGYILIWRDEYYKSQDARFSK